MEYEINVEKICTKKFMWDLCRSSNCMTPFIFMVLSILFCHSAKRIRFFYLFYSVNFLVFVCLTYELHKTTNGESALP